MALQSGSFRRAIICLATAICLLRAEGKRGITPEDYFSIKSLPFPQIATEKNAGDLRLTAFDQKKNRRSSAIWLVPTDGGADPRQLTAEEFSSTSPRWSHN